MVKYVGPVFTLLMMVGSFAMSVFFALKEVPIGEMSMTVMCGISIFVVVKRDWPDIWKPLLNG